MICKIFEQQGYPVYYSDKRAKYLINTHKELQQHIVALLGKEAFDNGEYNRNYVAKKVFLDNDLLNQLNALVHPYVDEDFKIFITSNDAKIVFKESALLFDNDSYKELDETIYVSSPTSLRI